ncbi:MAG: hypothetical protein A2X64_11345 [Ignavibacteria bacterium GWF2_33_9]|nr:MAG: hypothetical protein A2X64_11345 [Ignavibacteria bacterium GWF2_33_9]
MKRFLEKRSSKIIGFVLFCTVSLAVFIPDFFSVFAQNAPQIGAEKAPVVVPDVVQQFNNSIINASQSVVPSVVFISVESERKSEQSELFRQFHDFFGQMPEGMQKVRGAGSGVIISGDGFIVTNNHVVDGAIEGKIKVILNDKSEHKATIIGQDPSTDLAVIKIEAENLKPVHFADANSIKVGDFVIAVGNPLGLHSTVTQGIVSAIGRGQLGLPRQSNYTIENYIQTDAAINPGNSGGGLFDLSGSLVGINSAIATENGGFMGYGFAIPVDIVEAIIDDLIEDGKVNRPILGVMITNIDEITARSLGLDKVQGVLVSDVMENSSAEKGGIKSQDVILSINEMTVNSVSELQNSIVLKKVGDKVQVKLWRNKKEITKTITLQERTDDVTVKTSDDDSDNSHSSNETVTFKDLGFSVTGLSQSDKDALKVKSGVMIKSVDRDSPAAARGIQPNGVITSADMQDIATTGQLKKIINSKKSGDAIMFKIKYANNHILVAVEIP